MFESMDSENVTLLVLLDLSAAFDTVHVVSYFQHWKVNLEYLELCLNGLNLTWMVDDKKFLSKMCVLNQIIWPVGYHRAAAWGKYSLLCT